MLPLQLGPTGVKKGGELGVDSEEICLFPVVIVKFIHQRAGIGKGFVCVSMAESDVDFDRRGRETTQTILQPFPSGFSRLPADGLEKGFHREAQIGAGWFFQVPGLHVQGLDQDIKITLIKAPAGITDIETLDRGYHFTFYRAPSTAFDYSKQCRAKTEVWNASCCCRPIRQEGNLFQFPHFFLQGGRQEVQAVFGFS